MIVETGIVKCLENQEGKMFVEGRGLVSFNLQDGDAIEAGKMEPRLSGKGLRVLPTVGDCLIILGFIKDRVSSWGFFDEYKRAKEEIASRPVFYRVLKRQDFGNFPNQSKVIWQGSDIEDLCKKFPPGERGRRDQLGIQNAFCDFRCVISFQKKVGQQGEWMPCSDPRPSSMALRKIAACR